MSKPSSLITAKRLKELREEKKLSHISLSKALKEQYGIDISRDSLMCYEVSDPHHTKAYKNEGMRVEYLRCFSEFYDVSSDYLLGLTDDRNKKPSAVDELGLSNKAVDNIRLIRTHSDSAITALDTLLENADILILLEMISQLADSVKDEIQRIKQSADKIEAPILGMDRKTQLSCMDNNRMQRLVEELSNLHPDLRGRIAVFCGDRFLNAQMEDIKSSFECTLHRVTGYYELLSLQMELGRDYGND